MIRRQNFKIAFLLVLAMLWAPLGSVLASQLVVEADTPVVQSISESIHMMGHEMDENAPCAQLASCDLQCCSGYPTFTNASSNALSTFIKIPNVVFISQPHISVALSLRDRPPRFTR